MTETKTTITTPVVGREILEVGDLITYSIPDHRWWRRLWRYLTFGLPPTREKKMNVTDIGSGSTLTVEEGA